MQNVTQMGANTLLPWRCSPFGAFVEDSGSA